MWSIDFRYERVPRWIALVAVIGIAGFLIARGLAGAAGFALGAAISWWNYRALTRVVAALAKAAESGHAPPPMRATALLFFQLAVSGAALLVILKLSKISLLAALLGLFASCFGIALELIYESVWKKSTRSGSLHF